MGKLIILIVFVLVLCADFFLELISDDVNLWDVALKAFMICGFVYLAA